MPGVRVQHPVARNARFTLVEPDMPYRDRAGNPSPYLCPPPTQGGCGTTHLWKTHHLNLDDTGTVIVNAVLFERIKGRLALEGFQITGEVANPPPQVIGVGDGRDLTLPRYQQE